jgi:hypothetical protein
MRLKIIFLVLLLTIAILAVAVWLPKFSTAKMSMVLPALPTASAKTNFLEYPSTAVAEPESISRQPDPVSAAVTPAEAPARIVEELSALAMNHDAASLKRILAQLINPDPQIRAEAKDAAVQFGDRAAVPALRAAADQVENLEEKVALLAAADYLELPPMEIHPATNLPPSPGR